LSAKRCKLFIKKNLIRNVQIIRGFRVTNIVNCNYCAYRTHEIWTRFTITSLRCAM